MHHFLLSAALVTATAFAQNPTWIHNPQTGHDYALLPPMSWQAAQTLANSYQAHLVAIDSQTENQWVAAQFLSVTPVYLGLSDAAEEGHWRNVNGMSAPYLNWATFTLGTQTFPQPDNTGGNQHVAVMADANPTWGIARGQWDDVEGTASLPAVMERPPALLTPFGIGCPGSNGRPTLVGATSSPLPRPGVTISMQLTNLPSSGGLAFGVVSFSNAFWGPLPLPLDLGSYGMPGCQALVAPTSPGWITGIVHQGGVGTWNEAVPSLTVLIGWRFYLQAWLPDAGAGNALGATVTNGVEGAIGV